MSGVSAVNASRRGVKEERAGLSRRTTQNAKKPVDGGYARRVESLAREDTFCLTGRVRASWPLDTEHECAIGIDPTGQTENPTAATIVWTHYPLIHGVFAPFERTPVRPAKNALSIWLRGTSRIFYEFPFTADFDALALRRIRTDAP
jgi:hypothetical protein